MALTTHSNQPIPSAIHPSAYVQATDPGAVGANKQWVDTSTAQPYQLKVRNAANTAWLLIGVLSSGVTSVALVVPGELSVSGSPVTGAGTITIGKNQSATAPAIASGGVITTSGIFEARVAPTGAVTGVIMQVGTYAGQQCEVVNEAVAANTITFAASGTSGVANGTGCVVAGLTKLSFVWDSVTALWYPAGSGGGAGSVTSVGLTVPSGMVVAGSPVTGAGTLAVSESTQNANLVKAGPGTGAAATPTYRALVNADLPSPMTIAGEETASDFKPSGLTGATAASRYVGATTSGAPASGTFVVGDFVVDRTGKIWVCVTGGTPGTWTEVGNDGNVAGGGGLTGSLGADVVLSAANTFFDGPSVTVGPGSWLLVASVLAMDTLGTTALTAKLWDGTTVIDSTESTIPFTNFPEPLPLVGVVSPAVSTTYKVSVATTSTPGAGHNGVIKAATPANAAGNNASTIVAVPLPPVTAQSATAAAVATGGTITTAGVSEARVSPAAAVTGVVLQAGTYAGQQVIVTNEAVAANTVTFAASGTSNVADGTSDVIAGLNARLFVWSTGTSLWYPCK